MAHCPILRVDYAKEEIEALLPEHIESLSQISEREIIALFVGTGFVGTRELSIGEFIPFLALVRGFVKGRNTVNTEERGAKA